MPSFHRIKMVLEYNSDPHAHTAYTLSTASSAQAEECYVLEKIWTMTNVEKTKV